MAEKKTPQPFADDVARACQTMREGGVILYPTDTIWGIGCDATRPDAVRRVFEIKRRADSKALITLLPDAGLLQRYVDDVPELAYDLIEFTTRPLTIVYDRGINLAPALLGADGSVGIRVTSDPFCQALCRALRRPVVSTSANISGNPAPACFSEIDSEILSAVDYVAQWRRDDRRKSAPSSVMKLSADGQFKIIRE